MLVLRILPSITFLITLLLTCFAHGSDAYTRVDHSCALLTPAKMECLKISNRNKCCTNCVNTFPNCINQQKIGYVFFIYQAIPCPEGARFCFIENIDEIFSNAPPMFRITDNEIADMVQLIKLQVTECFDTHILLGMQCFRRDGCARVSIENNYLRCIECADGYVLTSDPMQRCQKCTVLAQISDSELPFTSSTHCSQCSVVSLDSNALSCTRCAPNFYFAPVLSLQKKNVCKPCQLYCECEHTNPCKSCISNKYLFITQDTTDTTIDTTTKTSDTPTPPLNQSVCVPCAEILEPHIGPNLRRVLTRNSSRIRLEDFIVSCSLKTGTTTTTTTTTPPNIKDINSFTFTFQTVTLYDIIDTPFKIPVFRMSNSTVETCYDGCAQCTFNAKTDAFSCLSCLNGFYLYYENKLHKTCRECALVDPDYLLCSQIRRYIEIEMQIIYPTQCKVNFLQPIVHSELTISMQNLCSVPPSCMVTEYWMDGFLQSMRSCKRCIDGYHRYLFDTSLNIYSCEENAKFDLYPEETKPPNLLDELNTQTFCTPSYYYDAASNLCIKCPKNCNICRSPSECAVCDTMRTYSKIIKPGIYECVVIPLNVSDVKNCLRFGVGELSDDFERPIGGFCDVCKANTDPVFNTSKKFLHRIEECKPKPRSCLEEDNYIYCKDCYFGYNKNSEGACEPYPEGCALFDSFLQICITCKYGYSLSHSKCIKCTLLDSINADGAFKCLTVAEEIAFFNNSLLEIK